MTLRQLLGFLSLVFSRSVCSGQQTSSVQDLSDFLVRSNKLYFFNVFCTSAISANSNPTKSTSSAYTISVGRVFSKSEVGRGKMVLTSFRAFSRYMENKTVQTISLWRPYVAFEWFFFCCTIYSCVYDGVTHHNSPYRKSIILTGFMS